MSIESTAAALKAKRGDFYIDEFDAWVDAMSAAVQGALANVGAFIGAFQWTYDSTTAMADPGTGEVRFNHATLGSVTAIALSALAGDDGNPNVLAYEKSWDDSGSSADRGRILVRKVNDEDFYALLKVTGTITDNTTWVQFAVTFVSSNDTLTNGDILTLTFIPTGPAGEVPPRLNAFSHFFQTV